MDTFFESSNFFSILHSNYLRITVWMSRLTETVKFTVQIRLYSILQLLTWCRNCVRRAETASVDNFLISLKTGIFFSSFLFLFIISNCWTIAVKPGINLDTAFCTTAPVAFLLLEMLCHMIGSTLGTCKLSTLGGLIKFSGSFFTSSDCPTDYKPSLTTSASPLSIAGPDFSVPLKANFNSFKMSTSVSSSESSFSSDKILYNSFEVEGCCVSGIWCVSSFDTSMSESSSLSLSFSYNFLFY